MPPQGRNDLCSCDSGKKYKHCCLGRTQTATGITPQDRTEALTALLRYSRRDEFADAVAMATLRWADQPDDDVQDAMASILEQETSTQAFFEWLTLDLELEQGGTMASRFIDGRHWSVSARAADHIRLLLDTHLGAYQVREVRIDSGLVVRDLWAKDEFFVTERRGSSQLVKWDIVVARVKAHADGSRQFEGTIMALPPAAAKPLLKDLKAEHKWFMKRRPDAPLEAFFKHAGPVFHDHWRDYATQPPPTVRTAEGDDIILCELVFAVPKAGDALAQLLAQHDFEPGEPGSAAWLDEGTAPRRILAEVTGNKGTLTVTAFSRERAARARARLERQFGALVLRRERYRTPGDDPPPLPATSLEGAIALDQVPELADWLTERDREWLDLEIPALDGSTPRQAAKDRRLRGRLRDLLVEMENLEARMAGGTHGRDLAWMWKELGLRKP